MSLKIFTCIQKNCNIWSKSFNIVTLYIVCKNNVKIWINNIFFKNTHYIVYFMDCIWIHFQTIWLYVKINFNNNKIILYPFFYLAVNSYISNYHHIIFDVEIPYQVNYCCYFDFLKKIQLSVEKYNNLWYAIFFSENHIIDSDIMICLKKEKSW